MVLKFTPSNNTCILLSFLFQVQPINVAYQLLHFALDPSNFNLLHFLISTFIATLVSP
ncbi:hypothetical protein JHK82_053449 [Glycine max]|uniref:Uncharacterized protein n=2 Tax=Glycine subgen. Soja TaxID=1462606 RepID=K7MY39_SOYBN|nr:hypothetical protein JHK86_053301 [Glycine max]KAG4915817.1 hypothetical protein JHK87_053374 [Glycine soja]KAG4927755.1 hypothetical protein JHK85_054241 [Glycine max]KAG5083280.1 hypothetical protein JHK84_053318 [Glycine max]KAG5086052.1 hypothetical protein JHK82_053449 [Glycine max]